MKYGEHPTKESAPEWHLHNVDYDFLKHMIEMYSTAERQGGVTIPGCVDEDALNFERQFYAELCRSYDNISLFVFSKAGELDRRLSASLTPRVKLFKFPSVFQSLSRTANEFVLDRHPTPVTTSSTSVAGFYGEQRQCDHDIQCLQRFIDAQLVAFQKILKEYKRWTRSSAVDLQFKNKVRYHPRDIVKLDVKRLQSRCDAILADLRPTSFPYPPNLVSMNAEVNSSCLLDASDRLRVAGSSRSLLLPGSSRYWNEYDCPSDMDGSQKTNECWLINIHPSVEDVNRRVGIDKSSVETSTDSDTSSSGRLSLSFSPYRTITSARASRQRRDESSPGGDRIDSAPLNVDDLRLNSDEGAKMWLMSVWLCLGVSFLSTSILAPFILTSGRTRSVSHFAGTTSGIMISLSAACAALCAMFSCEVLVRRTTKFMVLVAFLVSCGVNSALLVFLLRNWERST